MTAELLEAVINVSEGRDLSRVAAIGGAAEPCLLDVHTDAHHNRSVMTLAGPAPEVQRSARSVATAALEVLDLRDHDGVHPRLGVLDVVPFVAVAGSPLRDGPLSLALAARDAFAAWAGGDMDLPCFLYGPERSLPDLRRSAWVDLLPDTGPTGPDPRWGGVCVGARSVLVAYNLWLAASDLAKARRVCREIRSEHLRTLAFAVGESVQVSCNLIAPWTVGPGAVFDAVASRADVARAELVGLVPASVMAAEPRHRWAELGLDPSTTIEARLEQAGLGGGRFGTH